jgi:D-alanine-D-alanine ligase
VDYDLKWHPGTIPGHLSPRKIPAALAADQTAQLQELACRVWRACGCRDYARIDCRMDRAGLVYVLEVNVNCDLSPLAGFAQALQVATVPFAEFVGLMLANAGRRRRGDRGSVVGDRWPVIGDRGSVIGGRGSAD